MRHVFFLRQAEGSSTPKTFTKGLTVCVTCAGGHNLSDCDHRPPRQVNAVLVCALGTLRNFAQKLTTWAAKTVCRANSLVRYKRISNKSFPCSLSLSRYSRYLLSIRSGLTMVCVTRVCENARPHFYSPIPAPTVTLHTSGYALLGTLSFAYLAIRYKLAGLPESIHLATSHQ